jgi:hypothetical protein
MVSPRLAAPCRPGMGQHVLPFLLGVAAPVALVAWLLIAA